MVSVFVGLFPDSCLKSLRVEGHAGSDKKDYNLVCTAVSVLVRTTLNVLDREKRVVFQGSVPEEGSADLRIQHPESGLGNWLKGVTDFLLTGLFDLLAEYPEHLAIAFEHSDLED